MCLVKVIVGSWVTLHGMDSGGGTVKMGGGRGRGLKVQVGKNTVEMERKHSVNAFFSLLNF